MFPEGHCLTLSCMNTLIKLLLYPVIGEYANYLSCHSFRGAIPSALGKMLGKDGGEETKDWGRWSSSAYLLYSRLKLDRKKAIFDKVILALGLQASLHTSQQLNLQRPSQRPTRTWRTRWQERRPASRPSPTRVLQAGRR
jgi:hypothetical protein